jgi:tetratricopeptide (TPR) repeat protein
MKKLEALSSFLVSGLALALTVGALMKCPCANAENLSTNAPTGANPQTYQPDNRWQTPKEESRELFLLRMARDEALGNDRQGADHYWQDAIALSEATWGPDHPFTAALVAKFAKLLDDQKRYVDAASLYRRALKIRQSHLDPQDASIGIGLEDLADNLDLQGKGKEAESFYRLALSVFDRSNSNQSMLSAILNNLGRDLNEQGRLSEAEVLLRRALSITQMSAGQSSPETALSLSNLAANLKSQGRLEEAKALRADAASAAPNPSDAKGAHPGPGTSVAEDTVRPSANEKSSTPPDIRPLTSKEDGEVQVLMMVANEYEEHGDYRTAERFLRQILIICESTWGPNYPITA